MKFYEITYVYSAVPITEQKPPEELLNMMARDGWEPDPEYSSVNTGMYQFRRDAIPAVRRELRKNEVLEELLEQFKIFNGNRADGLVRPEETMDEKLGDMLGDVNWKLEVTSKD